MVRPKKTNILRKLRPVLTRRAYDAFRSWLMVQEDEWVLDMALVAAERLFAAMPQVKVEERTRRSMLEHTAFNFLRYKERKRMLQPRNQAVMSQPMAIKGYDFNIVFRTAAKSCDD